MTSISSRVPTHRDEVVTLMGQAELQFTYNNEKTVSSTIFMQGNISNLLRSDILRKIELNWEELFKCDNQEETVTFVDDVSLNKILSCHQSVFDKVLETLKNDEVTLKIKLDAILKFLEPMPYAIHLRIELEKILNILLLAEYSNLYYIRSIF